MKFKSLIESYQDRVKGVADRVVDGARYDHGAGRRPDVDTLIRHHGRDSLEGKLGGSAWKDFHRDVKKAASPEIGKMNRSLSGKASAEDKKKRMAAFHGELAMHIHAAIGETMPDGDPHDRLWSKVGRLADKHGITDNDHYKHLNNAAKVNGYDSLDHQLADAWDSYHVDRYHDALHTGDHHEVESAKDSLIHNPWQSQPNHAHPAIMNPEKPADWLKLKMANKKAGR